ncbi:MGH1-like glycoside hydrolase domain-containing protein [Rubricoccus marinus]|uniref:Glucosidase n=1 Tax=Rubricoccus marinus TaxID=716817 RepID=A0A259U2B5_9BACT|nr:glucosidase [Rubricoccus marinus]OZC04090.1 glucosidase [Rubricoccus marinus]
MPRPDTAEHQRLATSEAREADWKNWGPYVADRAWGTVREDYSASGDAWDYFPHEHAHSRAYRWNEDAIAGFCNRMQNVCLGVAMWNEQDAILKERFFGVSGPQGNHGEDVKEHYFYVDGTPTHSYMRMHYAYPQVAYPYEQLVRENLARGYHDPEYELTDAIGDALAEGRYFDVGIEYAKAGENDILCRITATNRAPQAAPLHLLPHVWYRNTWSWGYDDRPKPTLRDASGARGLLRVHGEHRHLGDRWWSVRASGAESAALMFTENETNRERLFGSPSLSPYVKDAFHRAIVDGEADAVNPERRGTKAAAHIHATVAPGESLVVEVRYAPEDHADPFADFDATFRTRIHEADAFYDALQAPGLSDDERNVQRQAFAGLLWSKQFYHYSPKLWLDGDPAFPPPPEARRHGRNHDWTHLYNLDVLSMPDKWEYPWYAAWDLAFHMIPMALLDPEWSKRQLTLLMREWYQHPNGQLPAYEWDFGDVNPPVHAWAVWRVYQIDRDHNGGPDTDFLASAFHKLLLNFTWWVNQKDDEGNNVFQGGFLGLDNIGVFDRSAPLPTGGHLDQADGTAWMAMYCLNMLAISIELARTRPAYEDVATKFFEHFVYIAKAINDEGGPGLWDEDDGFYYDAIETPDGRQTPLKIRSFVGLIPLFAIETLEPDVFEALPRFARRMRWFIENRPELMENLTFLREHGRGDRCLLSIVDETRLRRILARLLDSDQFLSEFGLRSLSKEHEANPYSFSANGETHTVAYEPAESTSGLFGGNSNWRGPIWFPLNYLMIESLQKYDYYYGDALQVEMPTASGETQNLWDVAGDLSRRLTALFLQDASGQRPVHGGVDMLQGEDRVLFYEYFNGDTGAGLGASHQTGWTALVAKLIQQSGGTRKKRR